MRGWCSTRSSVSICTAYDWFVNSPLGDLALELAADLATTVEAIGVCQRVWGTNSTRDIDTYFAAATHGSYLSLARLNGVAVGASFAFLSNGGRSIHSHMTAVVPEFADRSIGRTLKLHQRAWALDRGMESITWTYDPLVQRNAWFNLAVLGTRVTSFHENYYGSLGDERNGSDESDRFEVTWDLSKPAPGEPRTVVEVGGDRVIPIPSSIETLRFKEPAAAQDYRIAMRTSLRGVADGSVEVVGLNENRSYVLRPLR